MKKKHLRRTCKQKGMEIANSDRYCSPIHLKNHLSALTLSQNLLH
jgi:hypothetical protein